MNDAIDPVDVTHPASRRLWLGALLILPIPLIWETIVAYATRDLPATRGWLGPALGLTIPLLSLVGVVLLPLKPWMKALAAIVIVPIACTVEIMWGVTFVCIRFGDCL